MLMTDHDFTHPAYTAISCRIDRPRPNLFPDYRRTTLILTLLLTELARLAGFLALIATLR